MKEITENNQEDMYSLLTAGNEKKNEEFNKLFHNYLQLLEASLCISYEISKVAEENNDIHLKILSEGFDNIIQKSMI